MSLYIVMGFISLLLLDGSYVLYINKRLRRSIEETQNTNMARTKFLSSVSRDIRTPIDVIIGMTKIAKKQIHNPAQVQYCLDKITLSGNHLLTLVNDILDTSQAELGKMTLHPAVFSLLERCANLINIIKSQIQEKELQFDVHARNLKYEHLYADKLRTNQMFINLLANAAKYTNPGGKIIVGFREALQPGDKGNVVLTYTVQDIGISMSSDFMRDIYQIFARAVDSRIDKVRGSGLGLVITKQMVELMNGIINCESEPGKGTRFIAAPPLPATEITDDLMFPSLHLLLADNDRTSLDAAENMPASMGVAIDTTDNGRMAIEIAEVKHNAGEDYPITIVSLKMPDMSEVEIAGTIRVKVGEDLPIILISAYDWFEMEDVAKAAGINGFINKSMFKSTIYEKINEYLHFIEKNEKTAESSSDELQGLYFLAVGGNDLNQEIIQELLRYRSITAVRAVNGQVCIDILKRTESGTSDTALMDIQMPVINGYEASAAICAFPGVYIRNTPITAMTVDAFAEDIRACLDTGMNGHIAKPVDTKKLFKEPRNAGFTNGDERKR